MEFTNFFVESYVYTSSLSKIKNAFYFSLCNNVITCDMTGGSDGNVKLARRSLTAGNSVHSGWVEL